MAVIPKPKRRPKRSSRRTYCDTLWSQAVRQRDGYCQMIGEQGGPGTPSSPTRDLGASAGERRHPEPQFCEGRLEAAHMIPRRHFSVRWELDVGVTLCAKHHRLFDGVFDKWAWAKKRLGEARWAELQEQAKQRWHRDYSRVIAELKACRQEAS